MPAVLIHAGAGSRGSTAVTEEARSRSALLEALDAARTVLEAGGAAVDAVQAAVIVLEAFELFNAGRGSVLCADGSVEMSAALMRSDRAAGAVAGIAHTENPILAARSVLNSAQVLLVGEPADALAASDGARQRPSSYFVTDAQRRRLGRASAGPAHATVGAVCLDASGELAAGTSTGGVRGQPPGRIGDCPLIGAGTWADARVAVSCTGDGEAFIRSGAARHLASLVEAGAPVAEAADRVLKEVVELRAEGGLIALDADGGAAMPFVSETMLRGAWRSGAPPQAWVL